MTMRLLVVVLAMGAAFASPSDAQADWLAPDSNPNALPPLPPPAPSPPPYPRYQPYQPPPPPPPVVEPPPAQALPPAYEYHRRPRPWFRRNEFAVGLQVQGVPSSLRRDSGTMLGFGGLVRFRPIPWFAVEGSLTGYVGRDYYFDRRSETAFGLNGLAYINPQDPFQIYMLLGLGWSWANVSNDTSFQDTSYRYFGGQLGLGVEWRLNQHFAVNGDMRGFLRGRTDPNASLSPEFTDPSTGRTSNTSAGVLFTLGAAVYF